MSAPPSGRQVPSSSCCRPYSPDLNPIEMAFAKLKTVLRQVPERTVDRLWRRIGQLLDRFTPHECANYLQAAGYGDSM